MLRNFPKMGWVDAAIICILIAVGIVINCGAVWVPDNTVTLTPYQSASPDSIVLRLQWSESVPLRGTTPVEGYQWQFSWSPVRVSLFVPAAQTGFVSVNVPREALVTAPATCGDTIFFQARVRPTGTWSEFAGWGYSPIIEFYCANAPPPPPAFIDLDTIPEFPMDVWPMDSINARSENFRLDVLPVAVGANTTWTLHGDVGSTELDFSAEQTTTTLCAFVVRDGLLYKALKDFSKIDMWERSGSNLIPPSPSTIAAIEVLPMPGRFQCVYVTALTVNENTF